VADSRSEHMIVPTAKARFQSRMPWLLGAALSALALIQALHRAGQGRVALLKWEPDLAAFWSGAPLYGVGVEGYPTLPLSLLLMSPFRALGELPGALAWPERLDPLWAPGRWSRCWCSPSAPCTPTCCTGI